MNDKKCTIDTELAEYESFFDHEWAKNVFAMSKSRRFDDISFNLCDGWKGAANTARFPWLVVHTLKAFTEGYYRQPQPYAARFIEALTNKLAIGVQPSLSNEQRCNMTTTALEINNELHRTMQTTVLPFDEHDIWNTMLSSSEFAIGLISAQRLAYASVYYHYEDFIVSCFKQVRGLSRYRIGRTFPADLAKSFSQSLADDVWSHKAVKVGRLVRHAIAHNGGRETDELRNLAHGFDVENGTLQIKASNTRALFNSLKGRAMVVLKEAQRLCS